MGYLNEMGLHAVSIHSQLLGWEMQYAACLCVGNHLVSIHSQLLGWEMLAEPNLLMMEKMSFNPLPAFRLGDALR